MKAIYIHTVGAVALTFSLAACIPASQAPAPVPAPVAAPAPTPAPPPVVQQQQYQNYLDAPQTVGTWNYGADPGTTMAFFGNGGNELAADFVMVCQAGQRQISLVRRGSQTPTSMRITTETTTRSVNAVAVPREGNVVVATLPANDPLLDAMAITKGRFAIEAAGTPTLYLPAWTEVTRVIEDCR